MRLNQADARRVAVGLSVSRTGVGLEPTCRDDGIARLGMRGGAVDVSASMSAVVIASAFGGPEVLSIADEPTPEPGPGEARIAVRAVGVNPVDCKVYSGAFGADSARLRGCGCGDIGRARCGWPGRAGGGGG